MPTIVIAQTQDVHEQISELLTKLRAVKKLEPAIEGIDPAALMVRSYAIYAPVHSPDELAKLVMRASEPGTWDDQVGTFVQGFGSSLVVKHNASGHRQVQKVLSELGVRYPSGCNARPRKQRPGEAPVQPGTDAQPAAPGGGGGFF